MSQIAEQLGTHAVQLAEEIGHDVISRFTLGEAQELVGQVFADTLVQAAREKRPITCRGSGCWGCCRANVAVTSEEGQSLATRASDAALARARRDRARYENERDASRALCPLLDPVSGRCEQYADRPLVCRGYNVVTPPDWCWPENGEREVATRAEPLAVALAIIVVRGLHEEPRSLVSYLCEEADRRSGG